MKTKRYSGYHMAASYTSLTIYHFAPDGSRMCRDRFTILPGRTRMDRYRLLCGRLTDSGFEPPVFLPRKAKKKGRK